MRWFIIINIHCFLSEILGARSLSVQLLLLRNEIVVVLSCSAEKLSICGCLVKIMYVQVPRRFTMHQQLYACCHGDEDTCVKHDLLLVSTDKRPTTRFRM